MRLYTTQRFQIAGQTMEQTDSMCDDDERKIRMKIGFKYFGILC